MRVFTGSALVGVWTVLAAALPTLAISDPCPALAVGVHEVMEGTSKILISVAKATPLKRRLRFLYPGWSWGPPGGETRPHELPVTEAQADSIQRAYRRFSLPFQQRSLCYAAAWWSQRPTSSQDARHDSRVTHQESDPKTLKAMSGWWCMKWNSGWTSARLA